MKVRSTALCLLCLATPPAHAREIRFQQTDLVADLAGQADRTDPALVNPWGLVVDPAGADAHIGRASIPKFSLTGFSISPNIFASCKQTTHSDIEGELI